MTFSILFVCLFVCSIFILISRESDGGAIFLRNPHPLKSCPFPIVSMTSYHWICCLFEVSKWEREIYFCIGSQFTKKIIWRNIRHTNTTTSWWEAAKRLCVRLNKNRSGAVVEVCNLSSEYFYHNYLT